MLKLIPAALFSFFFLSCNAYDTVNLASETAIANKIFCSPFNKGGFEGKLTVRVPEGAQYYEANSSLLTFFRVPDMFRQRVNSYIQLYSLNIKDKQLKISDEPLTMEIYNRRNKKAAKITDFIDHDFIQQENFSVTDFFTDYDFEIRDTAGRQALVIYLFNVSDDPIEDAQAPVLIPPFAANPFTYKKEQSSQKLIMLHPFYDLMNNNNDNDEVFLSKAEGACRL